MKNLLKLLTVCLLLPLAARAQLSYTVSGGQATVTGYNTAAGLNVVIPSTYNGSPVTAIGTQAFYATSITSVTIPNSVTSIGSDAFFDCSALTSITVNAANPSYASVNGVLFDKAVTTLIQYPGGLTGSYAIPNSVTSIGGDAFVGCSGLTSVMIGNGVTSIGSGVNGVFAFCSALTSITVNTANPSYASVGGVLFDKAVATLIQCPGGLTGSYAIPNSVTSIGTYAFDGCSGLTSVTIPNSVTSIGNGAFQYCSALTSVTIGNGVTGIGSSAFYICSSLTNIVIPNSVTSIGGGAFAYSGLTNATIGNGTLNIGDGAFYSCPNLANVSIGGGVTNIGIYTFAICRKLNRVYFQGNAPQVDGSDGSQDETVFYDASVDGSLGLFVNAMVYYELGTSGWNSPWCGVPAVSVPQPAINAGPVSQTVSMGANAAFTVTAVGSTTLKYQWYFASAPISGANAASYSLTSVAAANAGNYYVVVTNNFGTVTSSVAALTVLPFTWATNNGAITITGYTGTGGAVTIPASINGYPVTAIGTQAFYNQATITSVTIPNSVTSIGSEAFYGCSALTSVAIPNSVTSIGSYAFDDCSALTSVTIPNSVTSIGNDAFYGCSALTSVTIPNSVTSIGTYAFAYCSALASVIIPNSVTSLGSDVFYSCYGLTSITVNTANPNYASVGGVLFDKAVATLIQCPSGLTGSYTIPNSVTSIGSYAFVDCYRLTSVTIPNSVTSLGSFAFFGCSGLTNAYFQGNAPLVNGAAGSSDTTVFQGVNAAAKACYLSGTTGWGATYGGLTTVAITLPSISVSPASQTVAPGGNVTFSVTASGTATLGYQWYFANAPISGANGASYSLSSVTAGNAGNYFVVVTNQFGSANSSVAVLTVSWPFTWVTNNGAITITGYTGAGGAVAIPASINGYPVTAIAASVFYNQATITSVAIPSGVTSLGSQAFAACAALTNITVDAANLNYASTSGVLFDKALATLIQCPGGLTGGYAIPNGVTGIGYEAFYGCAGLTGVTLPNSLTSIGNAAFENCSGLVNVAIPNSVTSVGTYAFEYCSALTGVTMGSGVTGLGSYAFASCAGLKSVTISGSVTSLGTYAFANCSALTNAYFQGNAPPVNNGDGTIAGSNDGTVFSGDPATGRAYRISGTTGWGTTYGGWTVVTVTLPSISVSPASQTVSAGGNVTFSVTAGGTATLGYQWYFTNAIAGANGASYSLNNVVATNAGNYFVVVTNNFGSVTSSVATLTVTVTVPLPFTYVTNNGAITITGYTGAGGEVDIPASIGGVPVAGVGVQAFQNNTTITSLVVSNGVLNLADAAFYGCSALTNVTIQGNSLTNIGNSTFALCSALATVTGGNGVINMGYGAFNSDGALAGITLGTNLTSLGDFAFFNCTSLKSLTLPASLLAVGNYVFDNCSGLTNVVINSGVTSFGQYAFAYCSSLTGVTIPASVTTLGNSAFQNCSSLTNVTFLGNAPTLGGALVFASVNAAATVYYSYGTTGWGATYGGLPTVMVGQPVNVPFTFVTNNSAITITGYNTTNGGLNVAIPATINNYPVKVIGSFAFYQLPVTNVTIPTNVTEIDSYAFDYTGLRSVMLPGSVTSLGFEVFSGCSNLTNISADPSNPDFAGSGGALCDKNLLTLIACPGGVGSFTIPNTVTNIGFGALAYSTVLTNVTIPNSVTIIGIGAFEACPHLASVSIPNSVTNIGSDAFFACLGLTSVTIPGSVTSIGDHAFYDCYGLTNATFQGNAPLVNGTTLGSSDTTVFGGETGKVYYSYGTTGWGAMYGGLPAVMMGQPTVLPNLSIVAAGGTLQICWPNTGTYTLVQSTNLAPANWTTNGSTVTTANGTNSVTITPAVENLFFRLKQ